MRPTILIYSFFWILATGLQAQDHASLSGTITDQDRPIADAFVTLKGFRDESCVKLANKKDDRSADEEKELEACSNEAGKTTTDNQGRYSFPDLKPGWYTMQLLFSLTEPPTPPYAPVFGSMMCPAEEWGVVFMSPRAVKGKYSGFAHSVFFDLKKKQARRIDLDYKKKMSDNPECFVQGSQIAAAGQPANTESLVLAIPGTKNSLSLTPGPTEWEINFLEKQKLVMLDAKGRADGLLVTAFLQKVPFEATAESCRESRWRDSENRIKQQPTIRHDAPQLSMKDGVAMLEFTMLEFRGQKVMSRNIHAYRGNGHTCAEIHLSKVQFQPEDRKLFDEVLATVKFVPDM